MVYYRKNIFSIYSKGKCLIKSFSKCSFLLVCLIIAITTESLASGNNNSEQEEIRSLIAQLKNGSNKEADVEIFKKGKPAVSILIDLLNDNSVSTEAVSILGMFGSDALEAIPALMVYKKNFENRNRPPFIDNPRSSWFIDVALMKIGVHTKAAIPYLVKTLDVNDYMVRLYATSALSEIGPDAVNAVPALIKLINNKSNENAREIASNAIKAIGPDAKDAVPALIEILRTLNSSIGANAASEAIVAIGKPAIPKLREVLIHEEKPLIICNISLILGEIGPEANDAVPELTKILEIKNSRTCSLAVKALGKIGPQAKQAISNLTQLFNDEDPYIRITAANACCAIDPNFKNAAIAIMIQELESNSRVSEEAAKSLAYLGQDAKIAIPILTKQLSTSNVNLRSACTHTLGSIGPPAIDAVPDLLKILDDPYVSIRVKAAESLWQIEHKERTEVITVLVDALQDQASAGQDAANILATIGKSIVPFLADVIKSNDQTARRNAATALGLIGPSAEQAIDALITMLDEKYFEDRRDAAEALGKLGPKAKIAVPRLVEMLQDRYTRAAASQALAKLAPMENEKAMSIFISALKGGDWWSKRDAINALASIGPKANKAIPDIEILLYDSNSEVRKSASKALEQIRAQ